MSSGTPRVLVLGAGPAGVGAALRLRVLDRANVTVLEQQDQVGGNAGSFQWQGQQVDFGSHRLHPSCAPEILADIRAILGNDLLDRPRHGRIRLMGRWIHFPLAPGDLLRHAAPSFVLGAARDALTKPLRRPKKPASFATVLEASLGPTICRHFYFPYARKIWGLEPTELSAVQARRRVSAGTALKLLRKILGQVPGFRRPGTGRFYYPAGGFGQITEALAAQATERGATLALGRRVTALRFDRDTTTWEVSVTGPTGDERHSGDHLWSTIPISVVARLLTPAPPAPVLEAAAGIQSRGMVLVYVTLPVDRFTEFDAHYFPEEVFRLTRLSEPKNYAATNIPEKRTTLCAEIPAAPGDAVWEESDEALGASVLNDLRAAGLPVPDVDPIAVTTRRLPFAYPIYRRGYEAQFETLDEWAATLPNFVTFGRQGLFAHDNTHHALAMAYAAASCLVDGEFDQERWATYREEFTHHVVED